jgi:hypothetical protein
MTKEVVKDWIDSIRPLFPPNTQFEFERFVDSDDVVFKIHWTLKTDPKRPSKPSRLIRVVVTREAITDCNDQAMAGLRFHSIMQDRLSTFNPDHDNPVGTNSPVEDWVVSSADLC